MATNILGEDLIFVFPKFEDLFWFKSRNARHSRNYICVDESFHDCLRYLDFIINLSNGRKKLTAFIRHNIVKRCFRWLHDPRRNLAHDIISINLFLILSCVKPWLVVSCCCNQISLVTKHILWITHDYFTFWCSIIKLYKIKRLWLIVR